jgi:hypothetical protein
MADGGTALAPERVLGDAALVAAVLTAAMLGAGLGAAWLVYRWLGVRALQRAWLDLDVVWAGSLIVAGGASAGVAVG